jgi:hypothetical protein
MNKPQPDPLIRKNATIMLRNMFEVDSIKHYYKQTGKSLAAPATLGYDDLPIKEVASPEPEKRKTTSYCKKNQNFGKHRVVHYD